MALVHRFDPITETVSQYWPPTQPYSLLYWCRMAVLKSIGLRNLHQIDNLPLPKKLRGYVGTVGLHDFFIDADYLPPEAHQTQIYPAVCLIDKRMVNLKVLPLGSDVNTADAKYITSFVEEDKVIVIEEPTKTLTDIIQQSKEEGAVFDEEFLWLLIDEIVTYLIDNDIYPSTHFGPDCIYFLPNRQIFIQCDENQQGDMNEVMTSTAVYEAPEVLNMANPNSTAFTWSIGCIIHECLALEPAFYDPEGSNPFSVYMKIMENDLPPEPTFGSDTLKAVLRMCLMQDPDARISLQTLKHILKDHFKCSSL